MENTKCFPSGIILSSCLRMPVFQNSLMIFERGDKLFKYTRFRNYHMRESKHIGDIVVDLVEAFARVEEGKLTFEYSSRGYISSVRNSAGLTVPYYSNIMKGIREDPNIFFLSILAVPSLAAYVLTEPLTSYRGLKRLLKEIVKRAVF